MAATVREATGLPVAVAFDSDNLVPVARALRGLYPASVITIYGDDDLALPLKSPALPNVGREKAEEATRAVGGRAVFRRPMVGLPSNRTITPTSPGSRRCGGHCRLYCQA